MFQGLKVEINQAGVAVMNIPKSTGINFQVFQAKVAKSVEWEATATPADKAAVAMFKKVDGAVEKISDFSEIEFIEQTGKFGKFKLIDWEKSIDDQIRRVETMSVDNIKLTYGTKNREAVLEELYLKQDAPAVWARNLAYERGLLGDIHKPRQLTQFQKDFLL